MAYVDGYVLPVPKKQLNAYVRMAKKAGKIWREHGAVEYKECVLEDAKAKWCLPFTKGIKTKKDETVIFAYVVYKNRKHRDEVNKKVMKDKRLSEMCKPGDMPFDGKRMLYGGFKPVVSL